MLIIRFAFADLVKTEVISSAFFDEEHVIKLEAGDHSLFVDLIKTVLDHIKDIVDVAGILKTTLTMQYFCIFLNLLFKILSPSVTSFYKNLEIR